MGQIYLGSNNQNLNVIFDTGSDWLIVDTDMCYSCIQPVFNTS